MLLYECKEETRNCGDIFLCPPMVLADQVISMNFILRLHFAKIVKHKLTETDTIIYLRIGENGKYLTSSFAVR